jgi:hypothetical protein
MDPTARSALNRDAGPRRRRASVRPSQDRDRLLPHRGDIEHMVGAVLAGCTQVELNGSMQGIGGW